MWLLILQYNIFWKYEWFFWCSDKFGDFRITFFKLNLRLFDNKLIILYNIYISRNNNFNNKIFFNWHIYKLIIIFYHQFIILETLIIKTKVYKYFMFYLKINCITSISLWYFSRIKHVCRNKYKTFWIGNGVSWTLEYLVYNPWIRN